MESGGKRTQTDYTLAFKVSMVAQAVHIYSHGRLHSSLKTQTPDAVHRASLAG
jgi:transposase InsO family protein